MVLDLASVVTVVQAVDVLGDGLTLTDAGG
jgi:hypothetical protein